MCTLMFWCEKKYDPLLLDLDQTKRADLLFLSGVLLLIMLFGMFNSKSFIYFQF